MDRLEYGNCDISDWEGRLNTNNNNRALTGFWIESSLAISPKEQTEVMERIFGETSAYSERARNELISAFILGGQTIRMYPAQRQRKSQSDWCQIIVVTLEIR